MNTRFDLGKFTTWRFICRGLTISEYRIIHLAVVIGSKLSLVPDTGLNLDDLRMREKRNLCRDWEWGVRALGEAWGQGQGEGHGLEGEGVTHSASWTQGGSCLWVFWVNKNVHCLSSLLASPLPSSALLPVPVCSSHAGLSTSAQKDHLLRWRSPDRCPGLTSQHVIVPAMLWLTFWVAALPSPRRLTSSQGTIP